MFMHNRVDLLLAKLGHSLLRSRSGATVLRGVRFALTRVAPYVPPRVELPEERVRARVAVEVRPSTIPGGGLGLFATEVIEAGTVIGEYMGDPIGSVLNLLRIRDITHMVGNQLGFFDTSRHPEVTMRYICGHPSPAKQNVTFDYDERILVRASRRIEAGEELLALYEEPYWRLMGITPRGD
jgi:hypothetical protein